jgi:hypothetical protein
MDKEAPSIPIADCTATNEPVLCHPDRSVPGFPATLHWTRPRVRLSVRERRMKCISVTKFHRKSGVAQWRDLQLLYSDWKCLR